MLKLFVAHACALLLCSGLLAQIDSSLAMADTTVEASLDDAEGMLPNPEYFPEPGPLLSAFKLENKRVFTSLSAANQQPDSVYRLNLSNQNLKEIPRQVFRMVNLQELILDDNKIKVIPSEIGQLTNLQVLSITDNKLRVLPQEMQELLELERLTIGQNKIMELPVWVGGLGKLRFLDLRFNPMVSYEIKLLRTSLPKCKIIY